MSPLLPGLDLLAVLPTGVPPWSLLFTQVSPDLSGSGLLPKWAASTGIYHKDFILILWCLLCASLCCEHVASRFRPGCRYYQPGH